MFKGFKTLIIFLLISLSGWVLQFTEALKTCGVDPSSDVVVCSLGIPPWVVGILGMVGIGLRFITTTSIFKKED